MKSDSDSKSESNFDEMSETTTVLQGLTIAVGLPEMFYIYFMISIISICLETIILEINHIATFIIIHLPGLIPKDRI